ncbi:site-2 protease [Dongia mobilis]|uniref:Zinc metalloprotease n=1 Tax=Dongia mobilis TaxID=578943 RepID=A0A4R6WNI9_9PROT|nr:RIP metalloprotease RseP [Dongia mobilis]TDQ80520.1 site-2 protease [Dongia mobilis]
MDIFAEISRNGFWFLVLLTPLVFVHEMGHFLVARLCGVRVEVFSIGFGREIFGITDKHGTRWKFSLLPLGGYVRMFGMAANELEGGEGEPKDMSEADRKVSFAHKTVWQRAAIVAAGPAANFLFAVVVLGVLYVSYGKTYRAPTIDEVVVPSAAQEAGLLPGDRITAINGQATDRFEDVAAVVQLNLDRPLTLSIRRGEADLTIDVQPQIVVEKDIFGNEQRIGRLGIVSKSEGITAELGPIDAAVEAAGETYRIAASMLTGIWQMITGVRSADEIRGVLSIADMSGEVAKFGFLSLVSLAVLLSINLGLINLFPVPMLDGGHLAYYVVEAVRGRPLSDGAQEWGLKIGLAMVLSLMLFATWNDLVYLEVGEKFRALFN